MIRYALICERGHEFESWFQDSAAYDKQAKRGLVACRRACPRLRRNNARLSRRLPQQLKRLRTRRRLPR